MTTTVATTEKKADFIGLTITNNEGKQLLQEVGQRRTFKSGKSGYGVYGKMSDITTGKKYQLSINIIEIATK